MDQLWRAFSGVIPLFLVISIVLIVLIFLIFRKKSFAFKIMTIGIALSLLGIFLVTLLPAPSLFLREVNVMNVVPFVGMYQLLFESVHISVAIRNLIFNIILFIPLGFFLSWGSYPKIKDSLIIGVFVSTLVELLQYTLPLGRSSDIDDIILNTLGVIVGIYLFRLIKKMFFRSY